MFRLFLLDKRARDARARKSIARNPRIIVTAASTITIITSLFNAGVFQHNFRQP
jgi:hypothetical protein